VPGEPEAVRPPRRLLGLLIASAFTVMLNETMIGVAIPGLMDRFSASASSAQWLVSAYLLTLGCTLPLSGIVIQRLGPIRTLAVCSAVFLAGSVLALSAGELWMLVVARVVQAVGGAPLLPLLTTTVMRETSPDRRGRTMGAVSLVIGIAPACGPVFSGLVLAIGDWRWLFLPSAVIAALVAVQVLPSWGAARAGGATGGEPGVALRPRARARVDPPSAGLAVLAAGGGTIALSSALDHALPVGTTLALAVAGGASAVVFVRRQYALGRRGEDPVLDLRAFGRPRLGRGATSIGVGMAGLFGVFALLPIVAVTVVGLSPVQAGLVMLPGGLLMGLLAPAVGRLAERVPTARLTASGFVTMALATTALGLLGPGSWGLLLALHVTLSVGFALTVTPLYLDALGSQPPELLPHASTILSTVQQLAAGAGTVAVIAVSAATPAAGFALAGGLLASAMAAQIAPSRRRPRV